MKTKIIKVTEALDEAALRRLLSPAAKMLQNGGLVAFPTETVYGLGGNAHDSTAARRIYAAKGRPSDNPLIVHIAAFSELTYITEDLPPAAEQLAAVFWPGPLTLILKKNEVIPPETTGGLSTVAVRMPSHPAAQALLRESGLMIAAPSANRSGRPSPTEAAHVIEDLAGRVEYIIDGGAVPLGLESTIVDLTEEVPLILRPGVITEEMLRGVLKEVRTDPGILPAADAAHGGGAADALYHEAEEDEKDEKEEKAADRLHPKAPGMRYRHYAPRGELTVIERSAGTKEAADTRAAVASALQKNARASVAAGKKTALILTAELHAAFDFSGCGTVYEVGRRADEDALAASLFKTLRRCDADGIEVIFAEGLSTPRLGGALMNRLLKAAGQRVIRV